MRSALAVLLVLLTSSAPSAEAQRSNVGVLTCTLAKGAQARPGDMTCGFKPTGVGQEEKFTGHVEGSVQEERGKLVLIWAVIGPGEGKVQRGDAGTKICESPGCGRSTTRVDRPKHRYSRAPVRDQQRACRREHNRD